MMKGLNQIKKNLRFTTLLLMKIPIHTNFNLEYVSFQNINSKKFQAHLNIQN